MSPQFSLFWLHSIESLHPSHFYHDIAESELYMGALTRQDFELYTIPKALTYIVKISVASMDQQMTDVQADKQKPVFL